MTHSPKTVTQLLIAWSNGDQSAFDELMPLVHDELRRLASLYMRRQNPGHTLQPTALVNEVYLRLIDARSVTFQDRAQFFALAAQAIRHILIDHARRKLYAKRGAGALKVSLDEVPPQAQEKAVEIVALEEALQKLAAIDPRKSQIIELRYFGGLTINEVAEVLEVSAPTVQREWRAARAWLYREITGSSGDDER